MKDASIETNYSMADELAVNGFAFTEGVLSQDLINELVSETREIESFQHTSTREGKQFAARDILSASPLFRDLAHSDELINLVQQVNGLVSRIKPFPVKGIYFDKIQEANWKVPWHQDTTIAVKAKHAVEGYGPWSVKAGIHHVQPPVERLEQITTLRIHLDACDENNGVLRVVPKSHTHGLISSDQFSDYRDQYGVVECNAKSGDILIMKPLLLHSSQVAVAPDHRRIIHIEYAFESLPHPLEWHRT